MAPPLNRTAILINLAIFVGFSVFCISTQAPLIQEDILKRCQDVLTMHHIPIRGLTVDGRDVVLSGAPESAIASARARRVVQQVPGVRTVRTKLISAGAKGVPHSSDDNGVPELPTSTQQREVQARIDGVLQNQSITFRPDSAVLTPESGAVLDQIAAYLAESPTVLCEIRGYDSQSREARQKWLLALQRALAAEDYLESKGIADWRLSTRVFQIGEGTEGRRTDRVVDFVVKAR
jgi:outer membrane protein OmpA-like peptidoglycan-associated protein